MATSRVHFCTLSMGHCKLLLLDTTFIGFRLFKISSRIDINFGVIWLKRRENKYKNIQNMNVSILFVSTSAFSIDNEEVHMHQT